MVYGVASTELPSTAVDPGHRRRLRRARKAIEAALVERDEAIRAARQDGESLRAIAIEVGLTHVGVAKLLEREPGRDEGPPPGDG